MVKPVKLRTKEKMTENEKAFEKFTGILNIFHEKRDTIEDFKYQFSAWCNAFISEKKSFESLKSQAIAHLKLSRISRVLITAIVFICILETYTKFQKAFAYLGLTLYLSVITMNIVSNIIVAYRNSKNDYISEVSQYFENVYAMFQLFKLRLDVLRRRCNWGVKLDPVLSGIELEYSNQSTSYARLWSSAFHLYHVYGIAIGFIIFLLCCYFEYEFFLILEVFAICLLFSIAIAKDLKIHRIQEKLQENTKSMRSVTSNFLTWFENDSEMYKTLQEHQVSTIVTNLFLVKTLRFCLKPRYLNFAISITACEVFAGLNVSRNDLKNALMFLADGKYFVLDKLTVKTINTQVVKRPSKEKTAKSELPENLEINRCRVVDDNTKQITSENKLNSRFEHEDSEICSKHINRKLTSTHPEYAEKASKIHFSKNDICEVFKHKSKGRSFDENLPLRYELRKFEPEEEAVSSSDEFFPDSAKELCQNKVDDDNGSEKPHIYVEKISKKSICTGTSDAEGIEGKSFDGFLHVSSNSTLYTMSENELGQTKEEAGESVRKHLTKESELYRNTDELFISEYKDTNLKTNGNKTNESAANSFNKSVVISHGEHSCESIKRTSSAETVNVNELVATDFNEINDSNLHEESINKMEFKDESETINKDINLNLNGDKPIKVNVKGFMTDDVCLLDNHTLIETKNHIDSSEMLRRQFHESNILDKQEKSTGNNSIDKTNKPFVSDQSHQLKYVCTNLVKMSETHFSSDTTPSEKLFCENSESDLSQQNKNSFTDECNENQITYGEINNERLFNNSVYDTEIYASGSNSFEKELNEISDSGFFKPQGSETKSENKYRIIEEDKNEAKHSYAPPGVTNNIRVTSNTIKETETHSNQNETHENVFNENRKSYLHKQKLGETELMDMGTYDSQTKNSIIDNISNNSNANADKDIFNSDAYISENDSMFLEIASEICLDENEILNDTSHCTSDFNTQSIIETGCNDESPINENTTIDNSGYYIVDSRCIHVYQNIKDRPAISNINKSNYEDVIDSLANETEACLKVHETSDDIIDEHKSADFNQKSANETELISEFEITPKTIMERGVNLTGQMDTILNFKDIFENQNEQEKQNVEKNMDENIDGIINEDLSKEWLSKVYVKDICQHELYHENMSSISGKDLTLLKPCEIACNDRSVKLSDVNKENFIPENTEVDQNSKIYKGMKTIYKRKTSKNKNNRKIHPKARCCKPLNKKRNKRFSKKLSDSAGAIDHFGNLMEAFPKESTDLERNELISNDSKNFSLLYEPDNTTIGVAGEIPEQIKNLNDTKTFEVVQNLSLQKNFDELVPGLENHDKINKSSEIYQNFLILNQVDRDKLKDSITKPDCFFQAQKTIEQMDHEANYLEINFPHTKSQEIDSPVSDKELAGTVIEHEHFKQAIGSEHKGISMEIPYCEKNNKIEIACSDNIKTIIATPSLATKTFKNDNKCIISTNETAHNKNEFINVPKSEDIILYSTNAVVPNESEAVASTENIATDNSQSKSCLTSTPSRIIKKGRRRIRDKLKNEEQTNCVSLESSTGSTAFNTQASTEEESKNISIWGMKSTNLHNFESSEGIIYNASTCTEEENRNGLIVDKEQTDCVSLESAAGNVFNAKISTEEESGYKLNVYKEQTNRISLESSSNSVLNAKTSTVEENRKIQIMDKEETKCSNLESSAGTVFNANACTEEENRNGLILNKEQTECVNLESSTRSVFNKNSSTGKENRNREILDKENINYNKEQINYVSLESSAGGVFNKKSNTEEENRNRVIVDKEYTNCNKEQTSYVSLESSAESVFNPKINTKEGKSNSTHIINIHSLNERKIELADQLPLESGDTESEISFSEKSSCQKLIEDNHRIRCARNINGEVQSRSNESTSNLAGISNSQGSHGTRYAGNFKDEVQNKVDKSDASTIRTSNLITYTENEMTSEYTINPNNDHTQLYLKKESFATVTSNIENDIENSKDSKICHIRNILTHLWKNEQGKMFEMFPKYRNSVKRKIIHLEKELRRNDQECVGKLSVVDVKENRLAFKTSDGEEHFSSELEVTCKYSDDEREKIKEKRMRSWLQSMSTDNSCEISKQGLNKSKTPPTGSSEDSNFHFRQSTSPSDTSSDASGDASDTYNGHPSSDFFSTKQESFQYLKIDKNKNISLERRINRIDESSCSEISTTDRGVKWVSRISNGKARKMSNQSMNSSNISNELKQTARKPKSKKIIREMKNKKFEVDKESEFTLKNSGNLSYSANTCSTNKHLDSMPSDVQLNSGDFEALTPNHDVEQTNSQKTNQTDPLKYHLTYKNLELHVFDSSPSLTIRLIDENDDSDAELIPRWQNFVNSPLSSSNSSIHELQLPSRMSSSSTGETVKENININKGELKMLVGRSDYEKDSVSSDTYKNFINKTSMENISEITDIEDCDSFMNSENAEVVNPIEQQNKEDRSIAAEFHESQKFANKNTINESVADDNDVPGGYNETVIKETGVARTCSFKNSGVRDNGNLFDGKNAHKISQEKNKGDRFEKHEFHESENFVNKHTINESVVDNNDVKEIKVIAGCSYDNIDIRDNGNFIDSENTRKVRQHNNEEDRSTKIEFDESNEHFVNKHRISESVKIDNNALDINTETVVKEIKMLTSDSLDKDCDEVSDIRESNNLIDNESADKVSQQKNKEDRLATCEFHEPQNFINNHTCKIHESSIENNDVPDKNIETVVKETEIVPSCSSDNVSSEQYSVRNEIFRTNAINVTDKNINAPVVNDSVVPGGNTDTIVKETEPAPNCLYSVGHEISETDANRVSDININPVGINENVLLDAETEVTTENELSKDFQFETNGIKLTCKPKSEFDSVEVKFRKLEDKTKLTFKSGSKKLYLKMSSKT